MKQITSNIHDGNYMKDNSCLMFLSYSFLQKLYLNLPNDDVCKIAKDNGLKITVTSINPKSEKTSEILCGRNSETIPNSDYEQIVKQRNQDSKILKATSSELFCISKTKIKDPFQLIGDEAQNCREQIKNISHYLRH